MITGEPVLIDDVLFRRAYGPPDKRFLNRDGTATSRAFTLRNEETELSVDVKRLTSAEKAVKNPAKFVLFEIDEHDVRSIDLQTRHDPTPDNEEGSGNPAHALIYGLDEDDDIKPGILARMSRRVWLG